MVPLSLSLSHSRLSTRYRLRIFYTGMKGDLVYILVIIIYINSVVISIAFNIAISIAISIATYYLYYYDYLIL